MSSIFDTVKDMVEMGLFSQPRKSESELREFIKSVATVFPPGLNDEELEKLAKEIEFKQGIKAGLGAVVDGEGFEPWLDDAKASITPYYWSRYEKLLLQNGLPKDVIRTTDKVTDTILSRLGNPHLEKQWDRRGMVVGHVQSGKTANYTGLICKAADAGYRLIIIIAGIHTNLRNQTQERIDEGFIGFDSGKDWGRVVGGRKYVIGAGNFGAERRPVTLTTRIHDFNKSRADSDRSQIGDYVEPVVLVIKKNHRTLQNLLDWLKDNSASGDQQMIEQPMLLIDDEADNASINTKYGKKLITTINGQIRDLLKLFHRSCYVAYTATPFANIFIDPDQDDDMHGEDLFPADFIIGLDAPDNYFGATKVFIDGLPDDDEPQWLRTIQDNEDILPINHKQDFILNGVPNSLIKAVRSFLLARTIRNLRGEEHKHCSMLINASWRNPIQKQIRNRVHDVVETIKNSVRLNASLGEAALSDPEIFALKQVWEEEFADNFADWSKIQAQLHDAIAATSVVVVNKDSGFLEYPKEKSGSKGKSYIAVGGYALSRGLTLEGLTITWFLRNTMMYDTLMQMGRWFGYRTGYEDLCRIWMPDEAIGWYSFIANATNELHDELKDMEKAKATPEQFGLAVRSHPASLLVTARNKMGSGRKIISSVGLSNEFIETSKVSIAPKSIENNIRLARELIAKCFDGEFHKESCKWGQLFVGIDFDVVDYFLSGWDNAEQSILTKTEPVRAYLRPRKDDEVSKWDVLIVSLNKGTFDDSLGVEIIPIQRYVCLDDLKHNFMSFSGKKMRVASRGVEKAGVDPIKAEKAEEEYRRNNQKTPTEKLNYPDGIYRKVRDRPLLIIYYVQATPPKGRESDPKAERIPSSPVVAWGMSLPVSNKPSDKVEYLVNTIRYQEMFGEYQEDEDLLADDHI